MLTEKLFNIAQGGAESILWLLIIISVLSLGFILERWFALRQITRQSKLAKARLRELMHSNSLGELEALSRDKDSLEGRALAFGLRHVKENGDRGLEEIFNSFALLERPGLERSLNFLATVGSNAPFVGLLGTVLGIMKAFRDLSANVAQGNEAVMLGIAEALVATAVGLVVAIPAVIAYNAFQKQVKSALQGIDIVKELCVAFAKSKPQAGR
jgi:biopolymer transport protein TolQ